MNDAVVGIVVPAHNAGRFFETTLKSIQDQTFKNWECILVDDGSTDATPAIGAHFACVDTRFVLVRQTHGGPCRARNLGMSHVIGRVDFLTFMDADDVWTHDALETLLATAAEHPDAIGAHGLGEFIDEVGRPYPSRPTGSLGRGRLGCRGGWPRPVAITEPTTFETVMTTSVVFPPGLILVKEPIYQAAGEFAIDAVYAEDWDMLIRLTRFGDIAVADQVILGYRRHGRNLGASAEVRSACAYVRSKAFFSPDNSARQQRIARASWRAAQVGDAHSRLKSASACIASGKYLHALKDLIRLPVIVLRFALGRPASRIGRPSSGRTP